MPEIATDTDRIEAARVILASPFVSCDDKQQATKFLLSLVQLTPVVEVLKSQLGPDGKSGVERAFEERIINETEERLRAIEKSHAYYAAKRTAASSSSVAWILARATEDESCGIAGKGEAAATPSGEAISVGALASSPSIDSAMLTSDKRRCYGCHEEFAVNKDGSTDTHCFRCVKNGGSNWRNTDGA